MKTCEQTPTDGARAVRPFRALANLARFRVLQLSAARRECVAVDLVEALPLAQSSMSEHLAVLKDAGIVQGTVDGPNRCYCLDRDALVFSRVTFARLENRARCWPAPLGAFQFGFIRFKEGRR